MSTHYNGTDDEKRALDAFITLMRATKMVTDRMSRQDAFGGLTVSQFGVLEAVYHLGPLSQRQLTEKLLKSSGNLVTVVDNLEKKGLVERKRVSGDRRSVRVTLTQDGTMLIEELFPRHAVLVTEAMSVLKPQQLTHLTQLCKALGKGQQQGEKK